VLHYAKSGFVIIPKNALFIAGGGEGFDRGSADFHGREFLKVSDRCQSRVAPG
jgi:hypothetical protein